jgi:hypothetical protein
LDPGTCALVNLADGFQVSLLFAVGILLIIITGEGETENGLQKVCVISALPCIIPLSQFSA